jgi:hypothetical protein
MKEIDVPKRYSYCKVDGCNKYVSKAGYCWGHCKDNGIDPKTGEKVSTAPIVKVIGKPAVKAAVVQVKQQLEEPIVPPGQYRDFDAIITKTIVDAMNAKCSEWLMELHGMPPSKAIVYAGEMLKAVEGLGY